MFSQWHELHMGIALPGDIAHQLVSQLLVAQPVTPSTQMDLVDAHRFGVSAGGFAAGDPLIVIPFVVGFGDDGSILRSLL